MHIKRTSIGKFWPIARKGTTFLAVASHDQTNSIPLVVVLRDILSLIKNKKELKRLINEKQVKINQKDIFEENYPVNLFDVISLPAIKKNYRAFLSRKKKFIFEETSDKESQTKSFKVLSKKILRKGKIQLNLMYGRNIIVKEDIPSGSSVILNLKDNKIVKIILLEKGQNAFVFKGKHAGKSGKIENIFVRGGKKIVKITSEKERINVWTKNLILIE